ncbi:GNAT family N-acetyltransferase [Desulfobulbus propionicus]|jgi:ribosomal protein S18 acetylase RimI-like enzyme
MMDVEISFDSTAIDWGLVADTLKQVGMGHYTPEMHRKAFLASYTTVFVRYEGQLVGFGRAISDGAYQSAIYDVAVRPEYQLQGIGSLIVEKILTHLPKGNVILYASPGKESFYETLGFRRMKTGVALFADAEVMAAKGFTE